MRAILVEYIFEDNNYADKYNVDIIARAIVDVLVGEHSCKNNIWNLGWNKNDKGC